jgi:tetratricopeptide (TPR) repeat protein
VLRSDKLGQLSSADYHGWLPRHSGYANRPNIPAFVGALQAQVEVQKALVRKMNSAGVLLLFGTDAPSTCVPGDCIHEEFELLRAAGLSNYEALRTATFNSGVFVTTEVRDSGERFGVIAPGARADLVLLQSNPLDNLSALRNLRGVMVAGAWKTKQELEEARQLRIQDNRRRQHLVVEYEKRYQAGDIASLLRFLTKLPVSQEPLLNVFAVVGDADRLAADGKVSEGLQLLEAARRLLPDTLYVQNVLGRLRLKAGDKTGAERAFKRSLEIAPLNAVALNGLARLAKEPSP